MRNCWSRELETLDGSRGLHPERGKEFQQLIESLAAELKRVKDLPDIHPQLFAR
jgi:hypothetical protein